MFKPILVCSLLLVGGIVTVSLLSSCKGKITDSAQSNIDQPSSSNAENISTAHIQQFLEHIETRDINSAKSMFSNRVSMQTGDIDEQLQMVCKLFPNGFEIKELLRCSVGENWDNDYYSCETSGGCIVSNGTNEYELSFTECITDNKDSDRVGFMHIIICDVSYERSTVMEWFRNNYNENVGIWIYFGAE